MQIARWTLAPVAALWLAAGCAGNPQPGDPGYRYNVSGTYEAHFVVEGVPYSGTMTLATALGGLITGTTALTTPVVINSSASGTLAADSLEIAIPYTMPDGCGGTATLTGTVAEGGGVASGPMTVDDSCGGMLAGSFTLTR